jgi:hypothetical protein
VIFRVTNQINFEQLAREDIVSANNEDEKSVLHLVEEVQVITLNMPGSAHARVNM